MSNYDAMPMSAQLNAQGMSWHEIFRDLAEFPQRFGGGMHRCRVQFAGILIARGAAMMETKHLPAPANGRHRPF
jgi:hypothetical protein